MTDRVPKAVPGAEARALAHHLKTGFYGGEAEREELEVELQKLIEKVRGECLTFLRRCHHFDAATDLEREFEAVKLLDETKP